VSYCGNCKQVNSHHAYWCGDKQTAFSQDDVNGAVEKERERVKALLAPYAWHAYNCPKMNDHACTCGMTEVRLELWGRDERPAPEPMVKLHECYAKPPKKVRERMLKRNAT